MSSPPNARLPVSNSNKTHPNDQMSARLSSALPRACSGDMYAAVPRIKPACVIAGVVIVADCEWLGDIAPTGSIAFARPKSSTFTVPSARTLILAGLRSRWIIPCSCAASSARAICCAMGRASSSAIGPWPIRSAKVGPSTNSITSARTPSPFSSPWMMAIFAWFSDARVLASRSRRASRSASVRERVWQNLDRDLATKVGIRGAPHLAHAAHSDWGGDFIRADAAANSESHSKWPRL